MINFGKYGEPIEKYVWSYKDPSLATWTSDLIHSDYIVFLDNDIISGTDKHFDVPKIAWLRESKTIIPDIYEWSERNISALESNYNFLLTHDMSLVEKYNFNYCIPVAVPWVKEKEIPEKTKIVSMFNSGLRSCPEHEKRHEFMEKFKNSVDLYGRAFNPVKKKEEGLLDYMFSITVENARYSGHFSEKLTDCFASKTVPVYWGGGPKDFEEFFDPEGVIFLTDDFNIDTLTKELYYSKLEVIEKNYQLALNFPTPEDWIVKNILHKGEDIDRI